MLPSNRKEMAKKGAKRDTTESFKMKAIGIHGDLYSYDDVIYEQSQKDVIIICKKHGPFSQRPNDHLGGHGCHKCGVDFNRLTQEEFVAKSIEKHKGLYSYDQVVYVNNYSKVLITCPIHGIFKQKPQVHMNSHGCIDCSIESQRFSQEEFLQKCFEMHHDKYDYSETQYFNNDTKVRISCYDHGYFWQRPGDHYSGRGCPSCNESSGEKFIRTFLEECNVKFKSQFKFEDCKNIRLLPFDFAIIDTDGNPKTMIEFQGVQHFEPVEHFGGEEKHISVVENDKIKLDYCEKNNIPLLRIHHSDIKNIPTILSEILNIIK
jgi:hypothetical protein